MKLKHTFEKVDMNEGIIAVPVGENAEQVHGVLKLNAEGLEILNLLKEDTTEEKVVQALVEKYETDSVIISSYVKSFIDYLNKNSLLEL